MDNWYEVMVFPSNAHTLRGRPVFLPTPGEEDKAYWETERGVIDGRPISRGEVNGLAANPSYQAMSRCAHILAAKSLAGGAQLPITIRVPAA